MNSVLLFERDLVCGKRRIVKAKFVGKGDQCMPSKANYGAKCVHKYDILVAILFDHEDGQYALTHVMT